ncbi:hypothetical protein DH2020_007209 [Rehmannia glutinosa]|uniref:PHD-type domain-containing protein n=1 Tax=Rehmannia glutinosa TaxID=99300 RepID=A0ABR0TYH0_REHGL
MVEAHKGNNVLGGGIYKEVVEPTVDAAKLNGSATDKRNGSSGSGGGLLTYKRRRSARVVEQGMVSDNPETQLVEKVWFLHLILQSTKKSYDQASQERSHARGFASHDCSLEHKRNIVLGKICQSLETEGFLRKCIQDALAFHPGSGSKTTVNESVRSCEAGSKCSPTASVHDGSIFFDIIMSEKFAQLCNLLLEHGIMADKVIDLSHINSRMKEKVYESSPMLFHSDIQQLQKLGNDIIALAKCLSDKTMTSFREQVGSSAQSISEDGRHEKPELPKPACALDEVQNCRHCGETTDGKNGLVCDSCEEMYHISCIKPAVKEIPVRNWYCGNCTAKGIESPHDNCIACERLNAFTSPSDGCGEDELVYQKAPDEMDDKVLQFCKACRMEVSNGDDYRICGHSFCAHKFYHIKCLTSKQLISYGPCWYCPSCLCRACFVDRDDDKIVLCDGCDHAYHIYCMQPPRAAIPTGKWFCTKCDAGIQRVEEAINKSGGVDMLLNAAKTLNYDENVAAIG